MDNIYLPALTRISSLRDETADTKTFSLQFVEPGRWEAFRHRPGQFVEVSIFGAGEAPFCISSARNGAESFDITVRQTGNVTEALHALAIGDELGIRGPLGNSFPFDEVQGRDMLFIGGGIGLPPLRPLITEVLGNRSRFGEVTILYGARTPGDLVYKSELEAWRAREDVRFEVTVDVGDAAWKGEVGVVPLLLDKVEIAPEKTSAFVCGPPVMIKFVLLELLKLGLADEHIYTTLERHMRCGVGKCNHCLIGDKFVCTDGPVFNYQQMKNMMDPG